MLIEILQSILLGIVQGITEWLPISSTGHMILVNEFLHFMESNDDFRNLFLVVIQFGSILAVVTIYFHKLNPFSPKKTDIQKRETWTMWLKVLAGCVPAGIIGLLFDDFIDTVLYKWYVVAATLIIYGFAFLIIENMNKKPKIESIEGMSYKTALLIGVFQMLALIPGTSRSGATILGAVLLGTSRYVATEFSFFLAVPVMLGASGLKILKFFMGNGLFGAEETIILLIGMITAYVVSIFAIKFLMGYIKKHDFKAFGYYRIILGVLIILYFAFVGL